MTADDFGLSVAVNEAVEQASRHGILTCASLMVGEEAAVDAVARVPNLPSLRVGLHVVVADGRPVLPPNAIPALCDRHGRLDGRLTRAGFRFFFNRSVARQLEAEIRAQFAAFAQTGLVLDHVNAHKHMHLHPTVLGMILRIGREYGMRAMRLPYEHSAGALSPAEKLARLGGLAITGLWVRVMRWRLDRAHMQHNDWVLGLGRSGAMDEETVLRLLQNLPRGTTELYFHPATEDSADARARGDRQQAEFMALMSPRVRAALRDRGVPRLSFSDLG
ncbi:MAG: hopanoid biosynthesis-associated protein HpnK [Acidiferrobacter sp.]